MAQTNLNIRIDEELKNELEATCKDLGMNVTTAITIFAKKVSREKRIPFEVSVDPFYGENNTKHLLKGIDELNNKKGIVHDMLMED